MRANLRSSPVALGLLLLMNTACGGDSPTVPVVDDDNTISISLQIVSGNEQVWFVGAELPNPLVVKVTGGTTNPVSNHLVNFRVVQGGGTVSGGAATTNSDGIAQADWTLGAESGENVLEVRSVNPRTGTEQVYARFTATARPRPEQFGTISELLSDAWVLALVARLDPVIAGDLRAEFDVVVAGLGNELDMDAVGTALTTALGLVADGASPNVAEFAFLHLIVERSKVMYDAAMQTISVTNEPGVER